MAARRTPPSARRSRPHFRSRPRNAWTPLTLVKTTQPVSASRPMAASTGAQSAGSPSSTAGRRTARPPSISMRRAMSSAWCAGRVTRTVLPNSGRRVNQSIRSRRATTSPMNSSAGGSMPAARAAAGRSASGAATVRWPGVVARWTTAAGVSAALPASMRAATIDLEPGDAHVEDQRSGEPRQRRPVEARAGLAGRLVAGDDADRAGVVAVRQRDAGARRGPQRGGDARHDLVGDAGLAEGFGLLAAAAEDHRVAALEADDGAALARRPRPSSG